MHEIIINYENLKLKYKNKNLPSAHYVQRGQTNFGLAGHFQEAVLIQMQPYLPQHLHQVCGQNVQD